VEAKDSLDNFPTPPWATRALLEYVIEQGNRAFLHDMTCFEPACGAGHMAVTLAEYFGQVTASDVYPYGFGDVGDFIGNSHPKDSWDWIITNPPFRLAEEFILEGLRVARRGVAMLVRTVFIESVGRYERLFLNGQPTIFAQFTERVPMVKGRLDKKASTATGYAWIVWEKRFSGSGCNLIWIPPCRKMLERPDDYREIISSESTQSGGSLASAIAHQRHLFD
jgi:hypothetical protein